MRVTLDVYSGRQNPAFVLEPAEAERVRRAVFSLSPSHAPPPEPPGLGFRGWEIDDEVLGAVRVFGDRAGDRADPDRSVERLLLELGRRHLGDEFPEGVI